MIILPFTLFTCYQRRILIKLSCYLLKLRTENHKFIALIFRHRQSISMSLVLYVLLMRIRIGYTISDHFGFFFKLRSFVKCILNEFIFKKIGRFFSYNLNQSKIPISFAFRFQHCKVILYGGFFISDIIFPNIKINGLFNQSNDGHEN